jgi:hypothetical protein
MTVDELVKLVSQKVGISEDQAREAVQTVVGYLKQQLPGPIGSQIDGLLSSGDVMKQAKGAIDSLGGMFGKKK